MLKTIPYENFDDKVLIDSNPEKYPIEVLREFYNPAVLADGVIVSETGLNHLIPSEVKFSELSMFGMKNGKIDVVVDSYKMDVREHSLFFNKYSEEGSIFLNNFGVCDDENQVIDLYNLKESEGKFTVVLTPIRKKAQSERDGWRWHKWGEYIGTQTPTTEYLFDEEDIDMIYVYQVYGWEL